MKCEKARKFIRANNYLTEFGKEALAELDAMEARIEELEIFEKLAMESSTCKKCGTGIVGYCLGCKIKQLEAENKRLKQEKIDELTSKVAQKENEK